MLEDFDVLENLTLVGELAGVERPKERAMEILEVKYGMLMMVLCDREGRVYDVWITFGSVHEVRAFRERKIRSLWFRGRMQVGLWMFFRR